MEKIAIYPNEQEKELIKQACKLVGLKPASFCKSLAVRESYLLMNKNGVTTQ